MPTFRHGKTTRLFFDQYDLSSQFRSAAAVSTVDVAETSAFGTQNKTYVTGMKGGTVSAEGMFSGGTTDEDAILSAILGVESKSNLIVCPDGGATIHRRCWMASVIETTYNVTAPVSDIVGVTADFQVDSGVDYGDIAHGDTAESTVGAVNFTSKDWTTTTSVGGVCFLSLYTNTRDAGSIVVKLQDSADDAAFADITGATFSSVAFAALSSQRIQLATSTAVRRYVRAVSTITSGASGAYTFVVGFAKR